MQCETIRHPAFPEPLRACHVVPADPTRAGVVLIHEYWGLNEDMVATARRLAIQGFEVIAVDLFRGQVTDDADEAYRLMTALSPDHADAVLGAWVNWLRRDRGMMAVGVMGFCMGGHWALNAAIAHAVDATVVYYGSVDHPPEQLARIQGPVLAHFGLHDPIIPLEQVQAFDARMKVLGKSVDTRIYGADHAFARIGGPNYDPALANAAWQRTSAFLQDSLFTPAG